MTEQLKEDLTELGLHRYVSAIINAGYHNWDAVGDMTESDFAALGIRLGDRRKLQRELARRQLWPDGSPLPTPDELREYALSLQDNASNQESKNGVQHIVSEAEVTMTSTPAGENSPYDASDAQEGIVGETPEPSDSTPTLQINTEMAHDKDNSPVEPNAPSYLSAQEPSNDDATPMEDHPPLFE